jgi:hypothetical protein
MNDTYYYVIEEDFRRNSTTEFLLLFGTKQQVLNSFRNFDDDDVSSPPLFRAVCLSPRFLAQSAYLTSSLSLFLPSDLSCWLSLFLLFAFPEEKNEH